MFRYVGYLVDVAVRGAKVRPRLPRGFPLVYGTDELDALSLENPTGTLDVFHQETGDTSPCNGEQCRNRNPLSMRDLQTPATPSNQ
jgi:hypothetical protein